MDVRLTLMTQWRDSLNQILTSSLSCSNESIRVHEADFLPLVGKECSYTFQNKSHNYLIRQPNKKEKPFHWKGSILFIKFMLNSAVNCVKLDEGRLHFISKSVILLIPLEGALTLQLLHFVGKGLYTSTYFILSGPTVYYDNKKVCWYIKCVQRNLNNIFSMIFSW